MGHVVGACFVDLYELFIGGFVTVDIFGVETILSDVFYSLHVVDQLLQGTVF